MAVIPGGIRTRGLLVPNETAKKGKRGAMEALLVLAFEAAGKDGVAVKDLAAKLGVKPQNIHVWLATTAKKLGVKKVSPGKYAI